MAAGDISDTVAESEKHETEAESDSENADLWSGEHCATAGKQYEEHCAESFGEKFFHKCINYLVNVSAWICMVNVSRLLFIARTTDIIETHGMSEKFCKFAECKR